MEEYKKNLPLKGRNKLPRHIITPLIKIAFLVRRHFVIFGIGQFCRRGAAFGCN
jgi:hypothetical protein